jgi:hypothetical protein
MSEVRACYVGSDGDRTAALYARLKAVGPQGVVAVNLLRACKNSERAKGYKSRRSTRAAYSTKDWSIGQLVDSLIEHGAALKIEWGWGYDAKAVNFEHVLYVEVPDCGQISFHIGWRRGGADHAKPWDGARGTGAARAIRYAESVLGIDVSFSPSNAGLNQGGQDGARSDRAEGADAARDEGGEVREAEGQAALDL